MTETDDTLEISPGQDRTIALSIPPRSEISQPLSGGDDNHFLQVRVEIARNGARVGKKLGQLTWHEEWQLFSADKWMRKVHFQNDTDTMVRFKATFRLAI